MQAGNDACDHRCGLPVGRWLHHRAIDHRRHAAALAALFAEGRTVVPNACPPVTGAAEVERCYTGHGGPIHLRALDHAISGGHAYIIGEYADKPEHPAGGKFVLTLVEAGGRWLIVADMDRPYGRGQSGPTPVPSGQS